MMFISKRNMPRCALQTGDIKLRCKIKICGKLLDRIWKMQHQHLNSHWAGETSILKIKQGENEPENIIRNREMFAVTWH